LWAKSRARSADEDPPTVAQHCQEVCAAMTVIWDALEDDLSCALQIELASLRRELRILCLVSALLHDIGKASSAFQSMVRRQLKKRQPARHEILSAIIISDHMFLQPWLAKALGAWRVWAIAWASGGHHLELRAKTEIDREDPLLRIAGAEKCITLRLSHGDIRSVLESVRAVLRTEGTDPGEPPKFSDVTFSADEDEPNSMAPLIHRLVKESRRVWKEKRQDFHLCRSLAVLKAMMIAADVAGSALPGEGIGIEKWIAKAMGDRLEAADLDQVVSANLQGKKPRDFQTRVADSPFPVTVVAAGCGNGKTVAAYLWAKRWARGRKLFFAYPTTGTTSAGFEDYLLAQSHLERALIHGRAQVDLEAMMDSPDDDLFERASRLDSLKAWEQQVIACTVDTVLGLTQNQRRGLFSFPAITSAAFVFDEIHNYDQRLFGELLIFLRALPGVPALLMSASIPPARLEALRSALGERVSGVILGDPKLEELPRYEIHTRDAPEACWQEVQSSIYGGGKVLWVCNTVGDAVRIFHGAPEGIASLIYHSRFRYCDRVQRQRDVLDAFSPRKGPRLVVATQVCEMSLNIDADLLVSAGAPLPSLVQRLGRLNRFAEKGSAPRKCFIYPFTGKPYDKEDQKLQMRAADETISALNGRPCSQAELGQALAAMRVDERWPATSAWLDGGWESKPLPAREGELSITVVREEDLDEIPGKIGSETRGRWTAQRLVPWTVPMPLTNKLTFERRAGPYFVAPRGSTQYDPVEGAQWNRAYRP
jgi:CRISPR-associated endonuclease/helicase Cas3